MKRLIPATHATILTATLIYAGLYTGLTTVSGCGGSGPGITADSSDTPGEATSSQSPSASGGSPSSLPPGETGVYPKIVVTSDSQTEIKVKYRFPFEGDTHRLKLKIKKSVLEAAQNANKHAIHVVGEEDSNWQERYNLSFIEDPAQSPFLDNLHAALLEIAKDENLDGDRTVELITSFVQHIAYDTTHSDEPQFPVETIANKKGDCDDKSRLLVALLMRSGYRVATLHFDEEQHMAVGIRSNGLEYKNTGYSYIETTSPSLIGFPFAEKADVQLHTRPRVYRIGKGKQKYTASKDIEFLVDTLKKLEKDIHKAQASLDSFVQKCADAGDKVAALQKNLDESEANVAKYNRAVDEYNKLVRKQQKMAQAVNAKIELRNYIVQYAKDRYPTVKKVRRDIKALQ